MKHILSACIACLVLMIGCVSRESAPPTPDELPIEPVEITSESGARAYISALADEAGKASQNAKDFNDWQPWFEDWSKRNGDARRNVFKPYENSLNKRVGGKRDGKGEWTFGPYDPKAASEAAAEAQKGYRKVVP